MSRLPQSFLARLLSRRMSGPSMASAAALLEGPVLSRLIAPLAFGRLGVHDLARLPGSSRGELPLSAAPLSARPPRDPGERGAADLGPLPFSDWPRPAAALTEAYRAGRTDPTAVLGSLRAACAQLATMPRRSPVLNQVPTAEAEAAAATARYRAAAANPSDAPGPLCGIPIAIKEEVAIRGLPLRLGTDFFPDAPAQEDAVVVARLRAAGAVVAFQTPMTEFGMSPVGVNGKRTLPKNPHGDHHAAGGSSTGSAVAVCTGLCPVALGSDGGGSVRIPASLCGLFGLKPTFGRLPRTGDPFGGTLDHLGPLGASVADLAAFLCATCGPDPGDPASAWAPPDLPLQRTAFTRALGRGVAGLRIGVDESLWRLCDADVAHAGMAALHRLCEEGAELVSVHLPLCLHAPAIGYIVIGLEFLEAMHVLSPPKDRVGPDLRLLMAALSQLPATAYLDAQRLRAGLCREVRGALLGVDLLALPTTAVVAPSLSEIEMDGLLDVDLLEALVRYNFIGNLTGLPALTAPVGRKSAGGEDLPIGLQLLGDAWDEATVIAAGAHLERIGAARVLRPKIFVDLLGDLLASPKGSIGASFHKGEPR